MHDKDSSDCVHDDRKARSEVWRRTTPSLPPMSAFLTRRALSGLSRLTPLSRPNSTSASNAPAPVQRIAEAVQTGGAAAAKQAPNAPTQWSASQAARPHARSGPRFEQTIMELQPNPLSAQAMIANEPIRLVHGRKATCDGGPSCSEAAHTRN
jgi:NADH dehydrogenase (ubiquinone) Fe-S protein 6